MNEINIPFEEIMNMLKTYESTIKKEKPVLLVDPSTSAKKGSKSNKRKGKATKGKTGHCRRNCKDYLEQKCSENGLFLIEVNLSLNSTS